MTEAHPITLQAADGYPLAADVFEAAHPRAAVLVAPAMGVRRRYYAPFARYLAQGGISTLTLDYRGIGDSRRGPLGREPARMLDWAKHDLAAGMRELRARWPGVPTGYVGHSVGGQLLGFVPEQPDAALFVASQSGHWRLWDGPTKVAMLGLWYAGIPALTSTFGYLPMRRFGQGEDVPAGVARDWARWGRHPEYLGPDATDPALPFHHLRAPIRMYAIEDDGYAPPRSVRALAGFYRAAAIDHRLLRPSDLGVRAIGHFGFFREQFRDSLWNESREWLSGRLLRRAA